jgi:hypothetical protein
VVPVASLPAVPASPPTNGNGATPAAAPARLSPLRRERVGQLLELLGSRSGGRLSLDASGYLFAEAAGLPGAALDQAIEDAGERVTVARSPGGPVTVTLSNLTWK